MIDLRALGMELPVVVRKTGPKSIGDDEVERILGAVLSYVDNEIFVRMMVRGEPYVVARRRALGLEEIML